MLMYRGESIMEAGLSAEIKCQNTNPEELNQIYIIKVDRSSENLLFCLPLPPIEKDICS